MTVPIIELSGVGKRYVKYEDSPLLLTRALRRGRRSRREQLWALHDVELVVEAGESIGVIGRNGSGKTTLLRLLAGITSPTTGRVAVRGRVAPLIAVGVGFHPELTGRENVYVNGTVLGLSRGQIDRRFDRIVEFAELQRFIDTPVKFYSSGMLVRLGFSVALEAEPDVLLVDEVLAVGDLGFQVRSFERMAEVRARGTTLVAVSHNLSAIRRLASRAVVLHDGQVRHDGDPDHALGVFHDLLRESGDGRDGAGPDVQGARDDVELERFALLIADGPSSHVSSHVSSGDTLTFAAELRFLSDIDDPVFGITILSEDGRHVFGQSTREATGRFAAGSRARFDVTLQCRLTKGSFAAHCGVVSRDFSAALMRPAPPLLFYVSHPGGVSGVVDLDARLHVSPLKPAPDGALR